MRSILLFLLLLPSSLYAQLPINEEFNPPMTWATTNGAGLQFYGGTEYYATTNVGTTPYPNSSTITLTSPLYNLTSCATNVNVSFPLSGVIENGWDVMRFQYTIDGVTWINVQNFTGNQNTLYSYNIPNTAIRFRFRLTTDSSVNSFTIGSNVYVYYYDIRYFYVTCPTSLFENHITLEYVDGTLVYNSLGSFDHYMLLYSESGEYFENISEVSGTVKPPFNGYYKILGINGLEITESNIEAVLPDQPKKVEKVCNLQGQVVDFEADCIKIVYYTDGSYRIEK